MPPPPQKPEDLTRAFFAAGVVLVVFILMLAAIDHHRGLSPQSARADVKTKYLNSDDSISAWRAAPSSAREGLSRSIIRRITTGLSDAEVNARADQLARCINGMAGDGADTRLDFLTITQTAATCAATMGLNN